MQIPDGLIEALGAWRANNEQAVTKAFHLNVRRQKVATVSELVHEPQGHPLSGPILSRWRIGDALGCVALDAEGRGVIVSTDLPRLSRLSRSARTSWQLAAVHIAAAHRLRRRLALGPRQACVLSTDGKVLHADGDATERRVRERLRDAVVSRDRARTRRMRSDAISALALWDGLVAGRWTLIDRFERDGRRFIVAHCNETNPAGPPPLTRRERQVLSHLLQGDSLKLTSYALGIAPSTASEARSRALLKLGIRNLADLAQLAELGML
ncbi:MAG TPA: LuxR C-terminal-related transcriptional regulator [Polyangiaceae bacterium]